MNTDQSLIYSTAGVLHNELPLGGLNIQELSNLLRELMAEFAGSAQTSPVAEAAKPKARKKPIGTAEISQLLFSLGMPANLLGYRYLRYAIQIGLEEPAILHSMTTVLYPRVAEEFDTTAACVERVMRHAIEVVWDRGDMDTLQQVFGYSVNPNRGRPTNSEFISRIVDNFIIAQMN